MFKTINKITCALAMSLAVLTVNASAAEPPSISADSAIVMNEKTEEVLYEKNADKQEYPASMTKMMTCILSLEHGNPYATVKISPLEDENHVECSYVESGEWIRKDQLMRQMMLISDNGAAVALARATSGNVDDFVSLMNEKAGELGMKNTHFANPNGLPDAAHVSTARDMAILAKYAMQNPKFRHIVGESRGVIHYTAPNTNIVLYNTNELLATYPGANGVKTGWTQAARGCVTASASRDGVDLIAVVMHSDTGETRFQEAASLLNYGFEKVQEDKSQNATMKKAA
jgi:D-alanyl-D-alanine carboxypeptidase (penicillin-binding protein 5/6)